ncbi:T9SS type A sorting domain-containing protein [Kordia algicida OT-1]
MKTILPLLFFLISLYSFAQTGPGGVGTNDGTSSLVSWYRPDNGISVTGSLIDSWTNSAGISALDISETGTQRPTLITNAVNGYDEVSFNGSNRLRTGLTLTTSNFVTNQASSFIVTKADNTTQTSSVYTTDPLVGSTRFSNHIPWAGTVYYDIGTCCGSSARIQVGSLTGLTSYSIWSYDAHPSSGKQLYRNESLLQSRANTSTYSSHASQRFNLGANTSGSNGFAGDVTELIIFRTKVNTAQRLIIDNYLAAKYGETLSVNDLYTQDDSGNGNFDHDVAGIGQAMDGTNHTDSRGTGIVRMNTPSALSNGDFLFWGEETKDPTYVFSNDPINYTEQLSSKWRVSKVNDLGTVTVAFDITGMDLSGKQSCQPLQLVVDNDSDFSSPVVYDLTIVGTTAIATGVSFTDGDYFTLRYLDQIVWNGTSFFNGSGTANAPDNTDECLKFTVKSGATGTLTFDAHVREVEVESGGTITVSDDILLEVENQIEVNGTIDLLGEAQLIQNHTSTTSNSGTGELRIRQQGTVNLYNYNYWSAPVNRSGNWQIGYLEDANGVVNFTSAFDANPTTSPITLSNHWLYDFNAVSGEYAGWNSLSTTDNITPGRGYTIKGSGATATEQEYIFRGIPNDGNYSYTVVANNDFLIGNPYPSALDADQFINDNLSTIDGTLYFWEHFSTNDSHNLAEYEGGYATYNLMMSLPAIADDSGLTSGNGTNSKDRPTENIAVGQGFFVTIDNGGSLVFNNGQRIFAKESTDETIFYRNSNISKNLTTTLDTRMKIWLSFKEPAEHVRVIGLGYDTNATLGYDKGYDAKTYDDQRNELYWLLNNEKLCILALPEFDSTQELPLGIKITDAGFYNFSINEIENVPNDVTVYLKDIHNDIYYNLSNSDATIWLDAVVEATRFSIVFQESTTLGINEVFLSDVHLIYDDTTNILTIKNLEVNEIEKLSIYNLIGQEVFKKTKNDARLTVNISELKNGVYVLKIETDRGIKNFKFIKY